MTTKHSMYSLLCVEEEQDGLVSGTWIQHVCGTLEKAAQRARDTEAVNSHAITIAVVPLISSPVPMLDRYTNLRRLA